MSYRATLKLAADQMFALADNPDSVFVFLELGRLLGRSGGSVLHDALLRARSQAAQDVVAQHGSQARAAAALGISAPVMSRQISLTGGRRDDGG